MHAEEGEIMTKRAPTQRVLLVVERHSETRTTISSMLREEGYVVLSVADGAVALDLALENPLSLILLDSAFARSETLAFCRQLRACPATAQLPLLLMVTHEDDIADRVVRAWGVDDTIRKPLLWEELRACVKALLRNDKRTYKPRPVRASSRSRTEETREEEQILIVDDLRIDIARRRVARQGQIIEIGNALLFDLLVYLARHRGIVFTKEHLLTHVWRYESTSASIEHSRTVTVHIHWLRELLGDELGDPQLIQTVRGVGYRFRDAAALPLSEEQIESDSRIETRRKYGTGIERHLFST
jgi:DNA-binding response OmpR family regulator